MEDGELGTSLLQWVRTFGEDAEPVLWESLSNGRRLWHILHEVDSTYFSGELPEPNVRPTDEWTRKWQNLRFIDRQLSMYYRDVCNGLDRMGTPDLEAIATGASRKDLEKMIMIIIRSAMASSEANQNMAQRLMSLGREHAMVIATELRRMEAADHTELSSSSREASSDRFGHESNAAPGTDSGTGNDLYGDASLEREEELLEAQSTIAKLKASHTALTLQLEELRQDRDQLQEAFDAYRFDINGRNRSSVEDSSRRKLQRQTEVDRAYIEDLESQVQTSRETIDNYERQTERHRSEHDVVQKLRDEFQMLKAENDDLTHNVKTNDNLKKKIQMLQGHESANAILRNEIKLANERLEDLQRLSQSQAALEKEILEKKGLIRNQEYQINELTTTRKHAEADARLLAHKLETARGRHERDHEIIEDLRSKLQDARVDAGGVLETPQESEKQIGCGRDENEAVRRDGEGHLAGTVAMLEQQLEASDARLNEARGKNMEVEERMRILGENAAASQQVEQQLRQSEATIVHLREELQAATKKQQQPKPAAAFDPVVLERENRLVTSAWYDLASRLQNNNVSLGKRRYEPKSWIGKQRALVGPGAGLASSARH